MLDEEELKCALCSKEQKSLDNLVEETFHINNDPKCGHRFCSRCCEINFSKKRSFACPLCQTTVKKENLSTSSYDDLEIQRDVRIRKKVKSIFNRNEKDFETLLAFQEYEENVEDIIFNLVHGIDKELNEAKIKEYEKLNVIQIAKKQSQNQYENKEIEERILREEKEKQERLYAIQEEQKLTKNRDIAYKKSMNEYIIGEGDFVTSLPLNPSITTSTSTAYSSSSASSSTMLHPVYILLAQRPEPKVIPEITTNTTSITTTHSKSLVHTAGGFKPQTYMDRNMKEITSSFEQLNIALLTKKASDSNSGSSASSVSCSMDVCAIESGIAGDSSSIIKRRRKYKGVTMAIS